MKPVTGYWLLVADYKLLVLGAIIKLDIANLALPCDLSGLIFQLAAPVGSLQLRRTDINSIAFSFNRLCGLSASSRTPDTECTFNIKSHSG